MRHFGLFSARDGGATSVHVQVVNWTVGVLCSEPLAGTPPFETQTINETQRRIVNTQYTFPSLVKEDARDLIKYVLQDDFDKRLELE